MKVKTLDSTLIADLRTLRFNRFWSEGDVRPNHAWDMALHMGYAEELV